jgi:hypothetical protein
MTTPSSRPARASRASHNSSAPSKHSPPRVEQQETFESDEVRVLRRKYGGTRLDTLKELFPTWTDEDLLFVLGDVAGDVETAVGRISEGAFSIPSHYSLFFFLLLVTLRKLITRFEFSLHF